jgi:hypothetical protein
VIKRLAGLILFRSFNAFDNFLSTMNLFDISFSGRQRTSGFHVGAPIIHFYGLDFLVTRTLMVSSHVPFVLTPISTQKKNFVSREEAEKSHYICEQVMQSGGYGCDNLPGSFLLNAKLKDKKIL